MPCVGTTAKFVRRVSPNRFLVVAAALLLAIGSSSCARSDPGPGMRSGTDLVGLGARDRLNLLFVVIDTLRADRLSAYGYARSTSPSLDALASGGIRFERVLSQSSWTKGSMASLWTGTYPARTRVLQIHDSLGKELALPAERFRDAGFRTAGIFRNPWLAQNFGFGRGFDRYFQPTPGPEIAGGRRVRGPAGSDLDLVGSALEFLRRNRSERFFLYLHFMDVHNYVHSPKDALFGSSRSDVYDNAIHWVDWNLGRLFAELEKLGLDGNTFVVVTSDHGEEFFEHGGEGHARTLYREVVEVPLLLAPPFDLADPLVVRGLARNLDVWPTLLEVFGLPPLPAAQGQSLLPAIEAAARGQEPADGSPAAFAHMDWIWGNPHPGNGATLVKVVREPFRLIQAVAPGNAGFSELYADPLETKEVSQQHPEVARELEGLVRQYLREAADGKGRPDQVVIDRMTLEQLRMLGYAVE
jgi:arylsulfatase A-like enzyme